ncbi:Dps family protein [Dyadobacter frigoris]|uniref:DNA starvation/stationary phase protection protein n=1 Tax=Dyadobacter frigoris TaxID=2576211 RepID=A0A4U6CSK7_9BACT|nr:DNA starvation/stationary phase protection protein [Dyadobacter frigoris]TKT86527.1 DNA starvation/stationary phase protection protein [Dyadobacter frigoris]
MEANIEIEQQNSQTVATELLKLLADEYVLYTKTRNAYWNMEDNHFYEREKLFDEQANQLSAIIDSIAKRIRTMEHYAPASLKYFLEITHLAEVAPDQNDSMSYVKQLLSDHDSMIIHCRENTHRFTSEFKDASASDFATDLLEKHENMAFILRSHLK